MEKNILLLFVLETTTNKPSYAIIEDIDSKSDIEIQTILADYSRNYKIKSCIHVPQSKKNSIVKNFTFNIPDNRILPTDIKGSWFNGYAVMDSRNICPKNWHVPSLAEYTEIINFLGGSEIADGKLVENNPTYWNSFSYPTPANSGFNALGVGIRPGGIGGSNGIKQITSFYCSSIIDDTHLNCITLVNDSHRLLAEGYVNSHKSNGNSLRLIKNYTLLKPGQTGFMTGNDLKKYPTVRIGDIEIMSQNSEETKFRDGTLIPVQLNSNLWQFSNLPLSCPVQFYANASGGGG
jgi:uncharacterized protein (TIGR02145 family)